ncbi:MAG: LamG-like jellyroll fold domain-containing protein [Thermoguttaceae bacterium]|jgi:O-glycosyl hydrolase
MATFRHRSSHRRAGFQRRFFIEQLEDRRLLATVTLDPSTIFQTIEGWGSAPLYPSSVSVATAGSIMRDAGMNTVRVTAGPGEFTYTTGGNMTTPVPLSSNLDANVPLFGGDGMTQQTDLVKWLETNGLQPDRTLMIGSLWSPPSWMKITTGTYITWDNNGVQQGGYDPVLPWGAYGGNTGAGRVNPDMWTEWAEYVLSDVKAWEQMAGVPMYAFSFQNEPNVPTSYNSCTFDIIANDVNNPSAGSTQGHWDIYGDAVQALATELAANPDITTKFFGPELSQLGGGSSLTSCNPYNLGNYNAVRQDLISRGLLDVLDGWATHEYTNASGGDAALWDAWYNGSAHAANIISNGTSNTLDWLGPTPGIAGDNKEIWQTETDGEANTWTKDGAMSYGLKIQNALVYGHVSGYTVWDLVSYNVGDSYGMVDLADINNPTNSYKYDAMKQFSRYINPGAQRIQAVFENGKASIGGANELDTYNGLTVSAYNQAQDKRLTMVFTNMETSDQPTTITIPAGLNVASFQVYETSGTQKFVQLHNLVPIGGQISLTIPASSFVTITGTYGAPDPAAPTVATSAVATPSTVTGTTANLTALGADQAGESNLTYSWYAIGTPPAAVTFSANGTNAAKSTIATFSKAGTYNLTVMITNALGYSVNSNVNVTVNQTLTGANATISPAAMTVALGGSTQFSVYGIDQFGYTIATPLSNITWSVYSGGGTVSSRGLYTAPTSGSGTVTVRAVTSTGKILYANATLLSQAVWYSFDDGSGSTAADSSGNGRAGTLVNGPTWTAGEFNGGLALNGTSQYVTVPALNLNSNAVTMSGWVKRNGTQSDYTGIVFYRNGSGTASGISMRSTGQLAYHWNDSSSSWSWSSGLTVPDGVWTFVALVITPSNATMYMQPAGAAMQSAVNTASNAAQAFSGVAYIGQDPLGGRFFKGSLDDFRVINRSLSAAEIWQFTYPTVVTAANASTVTSTSAVLSVLGADATSGESSLTYNWSTTGTPPGPVVFSTNGTNAAKTTTATFTQPGTYNFLVTVTNAAGLSTTSSVAVTPDTTPPTVAINQAASQVDPTIASPINFTVVFSEIVNDFVTGDVTLGGTAGATTAIVTGNGTTYNVAVSGMTSDGTVIASIAAGVAHDAAGNASVASTSTDNVVTLSTPTHTWDGGSTENNLWTTKENWVGDVAPSSGDNLVFPAGAAQLVDFNDYTSGTAFGSITVSGSGYHFQGNAYKSSTVEVQPSTNVDVSAINTGTLTIGAGATVTIAAIPGGPLAALMANSALTPLTADALPPNQPETVAQPTAADTITSSSLNAAAIAAEPIAASTVLAASAPVSSEAASALASSDSLSKTGLDAVPAPTGIIADTASPVRLVGSAEERRIDTAFNRPMPQSPMYFRLDSTALNKNIESGLEQFLTTRNEYLTSVPLLGSLRYELPSGMETIDKHSTIPAINSRQAHIAVLQTNSRWAYLDAETDIDIAQLVSAGKKRDKQLENVVDEVLAAEDAILALL